MRPRNMETWIRPLRAGTNPYTARFGEALEQQGSTVRELRNAPFALPLKAGAVVFHWPNEFFKRGGLRERTRTIVMLARLGLARRLFGLRVIWVVHNIQPHDGDLRAKATREAFFRAVDGLIFLSDDSRSQLLAAYPQLAGKSHLVTRHGDYQAENRGPPALPVRAGHRVRLGMFGHIRRYKQPTLAARLVASDHELELAIAGVCQDGVLRQELGKIAGGAENVSLAFDYLPPEQLESLTDGVDAVLVPYEKILNSGTALYALTRWRPVIAPKLGSLEELHRDVGADWLFLYDGPLDAKTLTRAKEWLARPRLIPPDLSRYAWDRIAVDLAQFVNGPHADR